MQRYKGYQTQFPTIFIVEDLCPEEIYKIICVSKQCYVLWVVENNSFFYFLWSRKIFIHVKTPLATICTPSLVSHMGPRDQYLKKGHNAELPNDFLPIFWSKSD